MAAFNICVSFLNTINFRIKLYHNLEDPGVSNDDKNSFIKAGLQLEYFDHNNVKLKLI